MRKPIRSLRSEDGQAVVELALAIPLLLLVLFAIIQFGQAIAYYNDETNIANLAARYAIVGTVPNCTGAPTSSVYDYDQCQGKQESAYLASATTCVADLASGYTAGNNPATGDPIEVKVSFDFKIGAGLPLFNFLPTTIPISGSATMRLEADPTSSGFQTFMDPAGTSGTPKMQTSC